MIEETPNIFKAIELWADITKTSSNIRISDWHLNETVKELHESLILDPTEITTNLILTAFLRSYLKSSTVSLYDLLMESPSISEDLRKTKEILSIVQHPDIIEARDRFINTLTNAMNSYGATDSGDVAKLLNSYDSIAILRRDALKSINKLQVNQFISGKHDPDNIKPVYATMVYRWKNINSCISALPHMESGVSLNLISPPNDPMRSYFCFGIRNGGNIIILTDAPNNAHPLQRYMSRRPDRNMDSRISKNWFPYDLLDIAYDEKGNLHVNDNIQGLIPYQTEAYSIKAIASLDPECFAWTSMMFDLIVEKFWRQKHVESELSYTNEMLISDSRFLLATEKAKLEITEYNPIGLNPLTSTDVKTENITLEDVGNKGTGKNQWLEDRYGHLVPSSILNAFADPATTLTYDHRDGTITENAKPLERDITIYGDHMKYTPIHLKTIDPADFGSKNQIESNRKFLARANFATCIHKHAQTEYNDRQEEIITWYSERVKQNIKYLTSLIGYENIWIDGGPHETFSGYKSGVGAVHSYKNRTYHSLMHIHDLSEREFGIGYPIKSLVFGEFDYQGHQLCYFNDTKASYMVRFTPANQDELAFLAGCKVEDMPDVLQHWNKYEPYVGNHILNRIDPLEWMIENPWLELNTKIQIHLSKRAFNNLKKLEKPIITLNSAVIDAPWKKERE